MKLTPLEVDQQQFQRVFRGCDPDEVHRFLDRVSRELEELARENTQLRESLRLREAEVAEFRRQESQLREALVSAGRVTDEMRESARKEAELARAEAEVAARRIVSSAQARVVTLAEECQTLRRQKARIMGELRGIIEAHRRLLDTQEELDRENEPR